MRAHGTAGTWCSVAFALGVAFAGCGKARETATGEVTAVKKPPVDSPRPLPDPEQQGGHVGRAPRRITVAQLRASIEIATGRPWKGLDALAASLGRADFAFVASESTETNLVFAKFLEDGAREVCLDAAKSDLLAVGANRVLMRELPDKIGKLSDVDDAAMKKNLVYLSTRFWGQPLAGTELDDWAATTRMVSTRADATGKRYEAWAAMCIALITDARFITY